MYLEWHSQPPFWQAASLACTFLAWELLSCLMEGKPVCWSGDKAVHSGHHRAQGNCPALLFTAIYCSGLLCSALLWTALLCSPLLCTVLHCFALLCTDFWCYALLCTALQCSTLLLTALQYSAPLYTALHCSALFYTALYVRYFYAVLCSSVMRVCH